MLPNFVWANVAVVNVSGACVRFKNVEATLVLAVPFVPFFGKLLPFVALADEAGDDADVDGELCGDDFGLNDNALIDELTASIGRKHCASGLNVFVTSRSADDVSSAWRSFDSEKRILTAPFSPMRYETSPGSTQTANSAGKFSRISLIGTPDSRAARPKTESVGSPVFKQRNADPCKKNKNKQK